MVDAVAEVEDLRRRGLFRELRIIESAPGPRVVLDGREVLLMCSNDYLGLTADPVVRAAAVDAVERWGAGSGSSRLVSGNSGLHRALEVDLAAFKGYEECVLFGAGYLANVGVVAALASDGVVFSDALNHASLIDGCRLARAETVVYPHNDVEALEMALRRAGQCTKTVVTEAVFSMDGDLAPLAEIVEAAGRHGASVIVDEAHATGVVGPGGRGLVAELGLEREVDVVIGTLGKALGSFGAFACCDRSVASLLVNRARTLVFSTGLPPSAVGASRAALDVLARHPELVDRLQANARVLRSALRAGGFAVEPGPMPIVPLIVGKPREALRLCEETLRRGVFAQAIRPPTVPRGTSRLRVVAMATHTRDDLASAVAALVAAAAERDAVAP